MTDAQNANSESEQSCPSLRCPACSFMVPLPADACPNCQADLRSGIIPQQDEPAANRGRLLPVALILLIILGLAVVFFSGLLDNPHPPVAETLPSTVKPADGLADALDSFQDLPDQNIGVRPDIILNRTKNTAEQAEERRKMEIEAENFQP